MSKHTIIQANSRDTAHNGYDAHTHANMHISNTALLLEICY